MGRVDGGGNNNLLRFSLIDANFHRHRGIFESIYAWNSLPNQFSVPIDRKRARGSPPSLSVLQKGEEFVIC